jgi:hypothetical protein
VATQTYEPLANITVTGSPTSVTFSSISSAYKDLVIVGMVNGQLGGPLIGRYNGDSGANYQYVYMGSAGGGQVQGANSSQASFLISDTQLTATAFNVNFVMSIFDYAATDKIKSTTLRYNSPTAQNRVVFQTSLWNSTAAITSVTMTYAATLVAGSSFALYGIAG